MWDNWLRVVTTFAVFSLVAWWLWSVLGIVQRHAVGPERVSDAVMVALLATTTFNVLGLMDTVARYLFPRPGPTIGPK